MNEFKKKRKFVKYNIKTNHRHTHTYTHTFWEKNAKWATNNLSKLYLD